MWVVWRLEVIDPEQRISDPYTSVGMGFLLDKYSREAIAGVAGSSAAVYEGSWEGSYGSDNDACYRWWLRVPQACHVHRTAKGWPSAVEEYRQALDRFFCNQHHWFVMIDEGRTKALQAEERQSAEEQLHG
ncbi:hypothetical protein ACH4OH_27140 [Streptomyces albidoflavus]